VDLNNEVKIIKTVSLHDDNVITYKIWISKELLLRLHIVRENTLLDERLGSDWGWGYKHKGKFGRSRIIGTNRIPLDDFKDAKQCVHEYLDNIREYIETLLSIYNIEEPVYTNKAEEQEFPEVFE
jgi:hypothetical protein